MGMYVPVKEDNVFVTRKRFAGLVGERIKRFVHKMSVSSQPLSLCAHIRLIATLSVCRKQRSKKTVEDGRSRTSEAPSVCATCGSYP